MAMKLPARPIKLFGTEAEAAKPRKLSAGSLSAVLDNGALRYIRFDGNEVLRGISYIVRDRNWGTYSPDIEGLRIRQSKVGFSVSYSATCRDGEQAIRYEASIEGSADGTLTFVARGVPLTDFLTNRTGFVVLHPLAGIVGQPVEVIHVDGRREKTRFPRRISPGQPIFEIRSLRHTVTRGVTATVLMEGNKFEMEDHRNWMDASYKTYVCSLLDPWPYTLAKGAAFDQQIFLKIEGRSADRVATGKPAAVRVKLGRTSGRLPAVGSGVPMREAKAALAAAGLISLAAPASLVCQIDGREPGQKDAAAAFAALKRKTGRPVTLEAILPARAPADRETAAIAAEVAAGGLVPDAVVITQAHDLKSFQPSTPRPWGPSYEEMARAARNAFPGRPIGGGMLSYFTELNRKPTPQGVFDFVTHTVCPIVHAADDVSVMETLEALPSIFDSARAIIGKAPYHIGPSGIPCRDNPYGAGVFANPDNGRLCLSDVDPRQRGLFAAAWNLGLAAKAAAGGVDSLAIGSVIGPQGAIYSKARYRQPWFDDSNAPVFPVFHILASLAQAGRAKRIATEVSHSAAVAALAYEHAGRRIVWLANLTGEKQAVRIAGLSGPVFSHVLDESTFAKACREPDYMATQGAALRTASALELRPYAVMRLAAR